MCLQRWVERDVVQHFHWCTRNCMLRAAGVRSFWLDSALPLFEWRYGMSVLARLEWRELQRTRSASCFSCISAAASTEPAPAELAAASPAASPAASSEPAAAEPAASPDPAPGAVRGNWNLQSSAAKPASTGASSTQPTIAAEPVATAASDSATADATSTASTQLART